MFPGLLLTVRLAIVQPEEGMFNMAEITAWHPDVRENSLAKPLPWPQWPERLGLTISLIGLAGAGTMAIRQRKQP